MNNELYADLDIIGQRIIPDVKTIKNDEDSIISTLNSMNCSNTSYESYIINAKDRIGRMIDVTNTILNSIYNKWDNLYKTKNMKIDPTVFNSDFIGPVMRYSPETTEMTQENSIVTSFDYAMYEQFIEELQYNYDRENAIMPDFAESDIIKDFAESIDYEKLENLREELRDLQDKYESLNRNWSALYNQTTPEEREEYAKTDGIYQYYMEEISKVEARIKEVNEEISNIESEIAFKDYIVDQLEVQWYESLKDNHDFNQLTNLEKYGDFKLEMVNGIETLTLNGEVFYPEENDPRLPIIAYILKYNEEANNLFTEHAPVGVDTLIYDQLQIYFPDSTDIKMTEDELKIYCYLLEKNSQVAAKYLKRVRIRLNQIKGALEAEEFLKSLKYVDENGNAVEISTDEKGNIVAKDKNGNIVENYRISNEGLNSIKNIFCISGQGLEDGVNTFLEGLENAIINDNELTKEEYKKSVILQILQKSSDYDNLYELSTSIGNMIPPIAMGAMAYLLGIEGGSMALTLMGTSAYGNAKHQALVTGAPLINAISYGLAIGVSEVALEKFLGAIPGIGEMAGTGLVGILSQGTEEFIQEFIEAGAQGIFLGEDVENLDDNAIKSFIYGAITAGIFSTPNIIISGVDSLSQFVTMKVHGEEVLIDVVAVLEISNKENLSLKDSIDAYLNYNKTPIDLFGNKYSTTHEMNIALDKIFAFFKNKGYIVVGKNYADFYYNILNFINVAKSAGEFAQWYGKSGAENVAGFYSRNTGLIYLRPNVSYTVVIHEIMHKFGYIDKAHTGINEAFTDHIANRVSVKDISNSAYRTNCSALNEILDLLEQYDYKFKDIDLKTYFGTDKKIFKNAVNNVMGYDFYSDLVSEMDVVVNDKKSSQEKQAARINVTKLVKSFSSQISKINNYSIMREDFKIIINGLLSNFNGDINRVIETLNKYLITFDTWLFPTENDIRAIIKRYSVEHIKNMLSYLSNGTSTSFNMNIINKI